MSVEAFTIDQKDRHNYLKMEKDPDSGFVWVQEGYYDKSFMSGPSVISYRCDGFKCGEYDSYLIKEITRVLEDHPCTIQLSRWYPHRDPNTFLSNGEYSIATRIDYLDKSMLITFRRFTKICGIEIITKYELRGVKHVEKFLKFLQM